jgi:hypothetical protein
MRNSKLKDIFLLILGVFLLRVSLDAAYLLIISNFYESYGFTKSLEASSIFLSYCALFFIIALLSPSREQLSTKCAQFLCLMSMIPLSSYFACTGLGGSALLSGCLFWLIVIGSTLYAPVKRGVVISRSDTPALFFSFSIAVLAVAACFMAFGFSLNFSLLDVYEFRAERGFSNVPLGGYLIPWAAKIAIPFLILYFTYASGRRSIGLLSAAITAQVLIFAISGHKTFLFIVPALLIISKISTSPRFISNLAWAAALGIGACLLIDLLSNGYIINGVLVRRIFFVPAQLTEIYFEFFRENRVYLSHSILGAFIDYQYSLPPPRVIGLMYFGNEALAANTGVLADGFMNFGYFGVIAWALILSILLRFADKAAYGKNKKIAYPLIIMTSFNLINGALLTSILTHGILFAMLILILLRDQK